LSPRTKPKPFAGPSLPDFLRDATARVDGALEALLPAESEEPRTIHRAMRYSIFAGGKRLRPALVLLGARAAGADDGPVLPVACAVEMVHTYSLIHDDLPSMDDDDLRRGRPSCHKVFGEAQAILAGDALHTLAFETLAALPDPATAATLVRELARACGTFGMVGGQAADLEAEGRPPDVAVVEGIHRRKTGALLLASLRMGALASGASPATLRRLSEYGERLGTAFQIVDDVLDEEGARAELGKTPGKDRQRGKMTYPAAVGIEASRTRAAALAAEAKEKARGIPGEALLRDLADFVVGRRS
jgi:geranylgeranyl pyrophosphate synthase